MWCSAIVLPSDRLYQIDYRRRTSGYHLVTLCDTSSALCGGRQGRTMQTLRKERKERAEMPRIYAHYICRGVDPPRPHSSPFPSLRFFHFPPFSPSLPLPFLSSSRILSSPRNGFQRYLLGLLPIVLYILSTSRERLPRSPSEAVRPRSNSC